MALAEGRAEGVAGRAERYGAELDGRGQGAPGPAYGVAAGWASYDEHWYTLNGHIKGLALFRRHRATSASA